MRGPRFFPSSCSDPSRAAFLHADSCELYNPSRRSSRPTSPGSVHPSARSTTDSLYAAVNRRRVGFAVTSVSGRSGTIPPPSGIAAVPLLFSLAPDDIRISPIRPSLL